METHIYIGNKLARECAEMSVYMGYDFEIERIDDPADRDHCYAIVRAYNAEGIPQDEKFELAADCPDDLHDMFRQLNEMTAHYIRLITRKDTHK